MPCRVTRVLVVDDSALMREMIGDFIRETPGMELAGTARDGDDALRQIEKLQPDVITLDVQMPRKDGLQTLEELLKSYPVPVLMVSALTQLGANTTLDALDRGAMDYIAKPDGVGPTTSAQLREELLRKIRAVAGTDVKKIIEIRRARAAKRQVAAATLPTPKPVATPTTQGPVVHELADKCIALGISTGGPPALTQLFEALRPPLPPLVIVQHMPAQFTKAFAWRLNSGSALEVKEAANGDVLKPNCAYIAPGGYHLELKKLGNEVRCKITDGDNVSGHKPSVDVMMKCAAAIYGDRCLGVIMTGMGRDGADGCGAIRAAGGYVLGQDAESSDVYGMNKVALVEGHVDRQFHLDQGAATIMAQVQKLWSRASVGV